MTRNTELTLILALFSLVCVQQGRGQPLVKVKNGEILGIEEDYDGQKIAIFKGIPYAENPLRFSKPVAANSWDGVYNATSYGPSCMQNIPAALAILLENKDVSEDCLSLNVYVPENADNAPLTVMVWIHGGGFTSGQGQLYDPINMVAKGGVVIVTINYRLSAFGFLSTGDENSPGNYGLWDQLLALQWVKDNVAAFGGDPDGITIFGQSAGGWSVSLLLMSPHGQGMFQRAISQSGIYSDFLMPSNPIENARALADLVECPSNVEAAEMVECLRTVPAEVLLGANLEYKIDFAWNPIVDGDFLVEKPSVTSERLSDYDYMIGFTEMEGYVMGIPFNYTHNTGANQDEFDVIASDIVYGYVGKTNGDDQCALDMIYDSVRFTYTYWEDIENDQERLLKMIKLAGDYTFVVPSYEMAVRHRDVSKDKSSTYLYYFTYKSESPVPDPSLFYSPIWNDKATHGDELVFQFFPEFIRLYNRQDSLVSDAMTVYWTNFAKTGNPNNPKNDGLSVWVEFGDRGEYVEINDNPTKTGDSTDLDPEHVFYWLKYLPKLELNMCFIKQTPPPCTEEPLTNEGSVRHLGSIYHSIVSVILCLMYNK